MKRLVYYEPISTATIPKASNKHSTSYSLKCFLFCPHGLINKLKLEKSLQRMAINSIDFAVSVLIRFNTFVQSIVAHCSVSQFVPGRHFEPITSHILFREIRKRNPYGESRTVVFNKPSRATAIGRPNPLANAFDFDTCASMKPKQPNNNNTNWSNLC